MDSFDDNIIYYIVLNNYVGMEIFKKIFLDDELFGPNFGECWMGHPV